VTEQNRPEPTEVSVVRDMTGDVLLATLAKQAQESQLGLGLTLNVHGTIYSGILVGRDEWFRLMAKSTQDSPAYELFDSIAKGIVDAYQPPNEETHEAASPLTYAYIHLRETRVISGGQVFGPVSLWRIAIHDVSAWMFGNYGIN
jgi:hypothetical protein